MGSQSYLIVWQKFLCYPLYLFFLATTYSSITLESIGGIKPQTSSHQWYNYKIKFSKFDVLMGSVWSLEKFRRTLIGDQSFGKPCTCSNSDHLFCLSYLDYLPALSKFTRSKSNPLLTWRWEVNLVTHYRVWLCKRKQRKTTIILLVSIV